MDKHTIREEKQKGKSAAPMSTPVDTPVGLFYIPSVLSSKEVDDIVMGLDKGQWKPLTINIDTGRLVQQFGFAYNYHSSAVTDPAPEFPDFIQRLAQLAVKECEKVGLRTEFNQCIVNNYQPGQGISAHTDKHDFGPVIACFSLPLTSHLLKRMGSTIFDRGVARCTLCLMKHDPSGDIKCQLGSSTWWKGSRYHGGGESLLRFALSMWNESQKDMPLRPRRCYNEKVFRMSIFRLQLPELF